MPRKANQRRKGKNAKSPKAATEQKSNEDKTVAPGGGADGNVDAATAKERGNVAFRNRNYAEAVEWYSRALEMDPTKELFSNRSVARAELCTANNVALEDGEAAVADANAAIKLDPTWAKGYLRLVGAYMALLDYTSALDALERGLKAAPQDDALQQKQEELNKILDQLHITQDQLRASEHADGDKFELMIRWLKEGSAKFPKMYMRYYSEDYRGVHALTKIPSDDIILFVPFSHIMTSEVAKASEIGQKIIKSNVDLRSKHSYLAAFLLQEKHKGKESFWYPYINILPERYRNMPIFFTDDELKLLKGSFTLDKIADRKASLKREYDSIKKAVPEFGRFTHWEFVWARLVVITRIFGLVINGKKTDGLVPYADMLNHKRPRETKWTFDDNMYGFTITSLKSIGRGDEIYDSYGRKCNSRFFVNYGFALAENDDNEVVVRVAIARNDPLYSMKLRALGGGPGRENVANREFQIPANYREKKTRELFSFLRLCAAQDTDMMSLPADGVRFRTHSYNDDDEEKVEDVEPMSVRNEIEVLKKLRVICSSVLEGFETTLEEDDKQLAQPDLDFNVRNCLVMRTGEKRVLHWFISLAEKCIPMLGMQWKDLKKIAAKSYRGNEPFDYYVTAVVVPLVKGAK